MPNYRYKALNQAGRRVMGELTANNEVDLHQRLRQIGLELLSAAEDKGRRGWSPFGRSIKNRELIQVCLHLQQLSAAGVSLMDGLADVRDSTDHRRLRELLAEVHEDVAHGKSLSEAFGAHPRVFGTVFQSLLSAGEESGNLPEAFGQLVKHLKWVDDVNSKIKKATRYPLVMLVVMCGLFFFMMLFVVPQVVTFLTSSGQELPLMTIALIDTSEFLQNFWWVVIGAPIVAAVVFNLAARTSEAVAYRKDVLVLRLPMVGELSRKVSLSRFAHFFATMFQSGVPILTCLETAQRVVGNRCLSASLSTVRGGVADGNPLSASLKGTGEFPSLVVRMVKIGEESGNLGETLNNVTDFYDRDVNDSVEAMVAMIEPALTMFSGLLMAWIVIAVIGPIYNSLGQLGS